MGKTRHYFLPLAVKTLSLIGIYTAYGLLQERIIKGHYKSVDGTSNDTFRSAPLLVFCNRLTSLATGLVLAQFQFAAERPNLLPSATSTSRRQETWTQRISALVARIRPASPFLSYALVASLNNAATVSQYASLSYLSFTTSTLGKSAKMVPVLIIGHTWYGKRYKPRQWMGAAVVILGIWGYLASFPKIAINEEEQKKAIATNWIGISCLLAYLFFDGLTSTMQERLFGQAKVGEETFTPMGMGITGGIIDQMIWVNLFSFMIAFTMLLLSDLESTTVSIKLALASQNLQLHILMLSITSTAGLLVLFHVIATYGALIASLIMTIRQFVSIVCNAAWFGNMTNIPLLGWASIGFMAAGIWIKMDRRYDEITDENGSSEPSRSSERGLTFIYQYLLPLIGCPVTFVLLIATIEFACQLATAQI